MNIELHIERLILDGLGVETKDRAAVQAAVVDELTGLLAGGGLRSELLSSGSARSIPGGDVHSTAGMTADHLGSAIAKAVHFGIGSATDRQARS